MGDLTERIVQQLKKVMDPELGINVYDLGLIYDIEVKGGQVSITMTLTTPGCPLHDSISKGVKRALQDVEDIEEVSINLVWSPHWNPSMMSPEARKKLGGL